MVMMKIMGGKRPSRPPKGTELGLSDELWGIIQSSLAHEVEKRPSVSTFVNFLEKATPDIAALKKLTGFDANSQGDIQKLRRVFEYGDNTLLGMREKESLVVIEVFDQVSPRPLPFPRIFLTSSGFRRSTPRWTTRVSAPGVCTGFRKSPPGAAFYRRVTASPTAASLNPILAGY